MPRSRTRIRSFACQSSEMRLRFSIIAITLGMLSCSGGAPSSGVARELTSQIASGIAQGVGTEIRMGAIAGEWTRLYVFGPYTPVPLIQDSLGISGASARRLSRGIEMRDDMNLLVLRRGTDFESWALSRSTADFGPEVTGRGYDLRTAVFVVRTPTRGKWGNISIRAPAG